MIKDYVAAIYHIFTIIYKKVPQQLGIVLNANITQNTDLFFQKHTIFNKLNRLTICNITQILLNIIKRYFSAYLD